MGKRLPAGFRQERGDDDAQQENDADNHWYHPSAPDSDMPRQTPCEHLVFHIYIS
jgi:hypothetical protein